MNAGPLSLPLAALWPPKGWLANHWAAFARAWVRRATRAVLTLGTAFDRLGQTVVPCIFPLDASRYVYMADAAACKIVMNDRHAFVKNTKSVRPRRGWVSRR